MVSSQILCTCTLVIMQTGNVSFQYTPFARKLAVMSHRRYQRPMTGYNQQLVLNLKEIGVSNKIMQVANDIPTLATLGTSVDLEERLPASRTYALSLYGNKKRSNGEPCVNLDQLMYEFACKTDKPASAFPPTGDAFKQHVLRAKYQVAILVHSDQAKTCIMEPCWKRVEDG
jgi:hypothetical protein